MRVITEDPIDWDESERVLNPTTPIDRHGSGRAYETSCSHISYDEFTESLVCKRGGRDIGSFQNEDLVEITD